MAGQNENVFPMDFYVDDPSPRPWKFQPTGYFVVILADAEEGQRAEGALIAAGFDALDVKVYTGKQILENNDVYVGRRNIKDSIAGAVIDDSEGKALSRTHVRIGVRCGYVSLTSTKSARRCSRSRTSSTCTPVTTETRGRQTSTRSGGHRRSFVRRSVGATSHLSTTGCSSRLRR